MYRPTLSTAGMFESLASIGEQTKKELRGKVNSFQFQLAEINLKRDRLNNLFLNFFKVSWRIGLIVIPVILMNRYIVSFTIWGLIGAIALILGAQHLMYVVTIYLTGYFQSWLVSVFDTPYTVFQKFMQAFLITNTLASFIYIFGLSLADNYVSSGSLPLHIFIIVIVLLNPLMIYGLQIVIFTLSWLASVLVDKFRDTRYPTATIIAMTTNALFLIETYPSLGTDERLKTFISSLLEKVARLIQYTLPKRLRSADSKTDSWLRANFAQAAIAIRDLKRELLMTNPGTNEVIRSRLGSLLENAIRENWNQLEQGKLEEKPSSLTKSRVLYHLRNFVFAVLPLGISYLFQQTTIIQEPYISGFYVVSGAYLVLSIISFDPLVKDKLSNLREIAQAARDLRESTKH
jgi:hypothetical protein